jgi:hypothetical protein
MKKRKKTDRIIFHHALARVCSLGDIREWHAARGFADVGYHFFIRKNGFVERGRDVRLVGAHALWRNGNSIGICFEGDFSKEEPTIEQIEAAGGEFHALCRQYGKSLRVEFHRPHIFNLFEPSSYGRFDACPGRFLDREDLAEQMAKYNPYLGV